MGTLGVRGLWGWLSARALLGFLACCVLICPSSRAQTTPSCYVFGTVGQFFSQNLSAQCLNPPNPSAGCALAGHLPVAPGIGTLGGGTGCTISSYTSVNGQLVPGAPTQPGCFGPDGFIIPYPGGMKINVYVIVGNNNNLVNLAFGAATGINPPGAKPQDELAYTTATFATSSLLAGYPWTTPTGVDNFATDCGFSYLNWQQQITLSPYDPSNKVNTTIIPNDPSFLPMSVYPLNCSMLNVQDWMNPQNGCSLVAPSTFYDPPPGGYTYQPGVDPYPFYYLSPAVTSAGNTCISSKESDCPNYFPFVLSQDGQTLSFLDAPAHDNLSGKPPSPNQPSGDNYMEFQTSLVGVSNQISAGPHTGSCVPGSTLYCTTFKMWNWNTTYNGSAGGARQNSSVYPVDPGSGTGGVAITAVNGVPLSLIPSNQMAITATGLAYSRVTQTFDGTMTITNIGNSVISAPSNGFFQILFTSLPAGVTLANAGGTFNASPFVTLFNVNSLGPGQSASVAVQFKNPSDVKIQFTPVVYTGVL